MVYRGITPLADNTNNTVKRILDDIFIHYKSGLKNIFNKNWNIYYFLDFDIKDESFRNSLFKVFNTNKIFMVDRDNLNSCYEINKTVKNSDFKQFIDQRGFFSSDLLLFDKSKCWGILLNNDIDLMIVGTDTNKALDDFKSCQLVRTKNELLSHISDYLDGEIIDFDWQGDNVSN